jgi:hypothetical protein
MEVLNWPQTEREVCAMAAYDVVEMYFDNWIDIYEQVYGD